MYTYTYNVNESLKSSSFNVIYKLNHCVVVVIVSIDVITD